MMRVESSMGFRVFFQAPVGVQVSMDFKESTEV